MTAELSRIKESHKIKLNLDEDIQKIFFSDRVASEDIEKKVLLVKERIIKERGNYGSVNFSSSSYGGASF